MQLAQRRGTWAAFWGRFRAAFAWETKRDTGVWLYQENRVTGARRALYCGGGYQPLNEVWLKGGRFE